MRLRVLEHAPMVPQSYSHVRDTDSFGANRVRTRAFSRESHTYTCILQILMHAFDAVLRLSGLCVLEHVVYVHYQVIGYVYMTMP